MKQPADTNSQGLKCPHCGYLIDLRGSFVSAGEEDSPAAIGCPGCRQIFFVSRSELFKARYGSSFIFLAVFLFLFRRVDLFKARYGNSYHIYMAVFFSLLACQ